MSISASEKPLSRVFTSDYRFAIPAFQRSYSWHDAQMKQLLEDVMDACAVHDGPYFLGSLILVHDEHGLHQVIDGQQRLVSLSIIFAVLLTLEEDPQLGASLAGLLTEAGDKLRGIETEPRLRLREQDEEFFREYVQHGDLEALFDLRDTDIATQAQRNIQMNTKCAYDMLASMADDERRQFAAYLVNDVMFVIVATDDISGAYRIFDVMNMRGMPLTPSDVFKAKVVSGISSAARTVYARYWDDIMEPMGDDNARIERFFADLDLIFTRTPLCESLIADFTDHVLDGYIRKGQCIEFIDDVLRPYAICDEILHRPSESLLPRKVTDLLSGFDDYPYDDWKPVALWALVHSLNNLNDPDTVVFSRSGHAGAHVTVHDGDRLVQVLEMLDRVTGIDCLNGKSELDRRTRAATIVRDLKKGLPLQRIAGFSVGADEQRMAMLHLRGELAIDANMRRLLLIRANEQLAGGRITRPRSLNAVPIIPERVPPGSQFATWPAGACDYWAQRIGNFVLTQKAPRNFNGVDDFGARRDLMVRDASSRRFPLTRALRDLEMITPQYLELRQRQIIDLIAQAWRIDRGDVVIAEQQAAAAAHTSGIAHRSKRTSKRVAVAEVVRAGLLKPGDRFVWNRPRKHEAWIITVTETGFQGEDGTEYATPTAAARQIGGSTASLNVWKRESDGRALSDIWKAYRAMM
ncbi:GmrSD restriction endonuclease domain-containing protein [Bifidobacterium criceti]|uniref:DUF262 domain-containing protein n=1 Tax=Bifidobacterium criceti TaxID=1960969 RepID=A0A2A2EDF7_9BIFI|nr:DUF262 domain-containing protein [Bifidobacterium criceti]PAU67053.1 hypothetical protein B1526_1553 [Bifidobacterium criceti]